MALTYTYKITGLKVKDEVVGETTNKNAVVQTYWTLTGVDENGNEGTFSGATPLTTASMTEESTFVPFNELTEADVIEWVSDVVESNPGYKEHIESQIQKQIDQKVNVVADTALPWAPVVEEPVAPPAPEPAEETVTEPVVEEPVVDEASPDLPPNPVVEEPVVESPTEDTELAG